MIDATSLEEEQGDICDVPITVKGGIREAQGGNKKEREEETLTLMMNRRE